ncbi:RNA polymerase [Rhypophila decipiens]|uniref:RNA polymerase n=1 Tax=Rhypophila decipiens TaxID=261697 RepID=A0AAN7BDA1_9PEZI|nr:RNA polymerase [Rhypophila decipiens]
MPKRQRDTEGYKEPEYAKPKATKRELAKGKDAEGNHYFELAPLRRVGISEFKGKLLINIREYYNAADGELKPGKKGISLSLDQYQAFLSVIPELNNLLRAKGIEFDEPDSAELSSAAVAGDAPARSPAAAKKEKKKPAKKSKKANIEETSEEEDDE